MCKKNKFKKSKNVKKPKRAAHVSCSPTQEQEQMEGEQEKPRVLEARRYQTRQLLEACAPEDEDQLGERLRRDQELLDAQRRFYDDLEFQQLEVCVGLL